VKFPHHDLNIKKSTENFSGSLKFGLAGQTMPRVAKYFVFFILVCNLLVIYQLIDLSVHTNSLSFNPEKLESIKRQQLRNVLRLISVLEKITIDGQSRIPSLKYEELRQRIERNVMEFQYYSLYQGFQVFDEAQKPQSEVQHFAAMVKDYRRFGFLVNTQGSLI
jgi:hypothetical protein